MKKKRLLCRLGFHQVYGDTVGHNYGTEDRPFVVMETTERCNYCDWKGRTR